MQSFPLNPSQLMTVGAEGESTGTASRDTQARSSQSDSAAMLGAIAKGETVTIHGKAIAGYFGVTSASGVTGYVLAEDISGPIVTSLKKAAPYVLGGLAATGALFYLLKKKRR